MSGDDSRREAIVHALLVRYHADIERERQRPAADYAAMFPGDEELVLAELHKLATDGAGEPLQIGPYRVVRELGRGGQATVYLAHDDRLQRDVALKVLQRDLTTLTQELRLQREAATAARIDDAGICPVYEVGRDRDHLYLAMKHIAGESLAAQLQRHRQQCDVGTDIDAVLPPAATTLQFFERLLMSLHRAHEGGVIHRDLKPANVMVDAAGNPVLLDFGLAIATASDEAPLTRTGDVFGTPQYLSPERLTLGQRASFGDDLWAVAVSLYEALTLQRPFHAPTIDQVHRAILSAQPPPLRTLRPRLSRVLELVVATALHREPARRYSTAADFAADLRAVRLGTPIRARPPNPVQRLAHWHRRRPAIATAAWLLLSGLGATVALQRNALQEIRAAESETKHLNDFLLEKLLLATTPDEARGAELTAAQVFDRAMASVDARFPEPSRSGGNLHHALGRANQQLGRPAEARANFERAIAIRTRILGADAEATLLSRRHLIEVMMQDDAFAAAKNEFLTLTQAQARVLPPDHPEVFELGQVAIRMALHEGAIERAQQLANEFRERSQRIFGDDHPSTIEATESLANTLGRRGRPLEAEALRRDVLARRQRLDGGDAPTTLRAMGALASLLHDSVVRDGRHGRAAETEALYTECLTTTERVHGKDSYAYASALNNLASLLQDLGRMKREPATQQRAVAMFRDSLRLRGQLFGEDSTRYANALGNLGGALMDVRQIAEARDLLQRATAIRSQRQGPEHADTLLAKLNLMQACLGCNDLKMAGQLHGELAAALAKPNGLDAKTTLLYRYGMLAFLRHNRRNDEILAEAPVLYQECLRVWGDDGGPTGRGVANILFNVYRSSGDEASAAVWEERSRQRRPPGTTK